MLAQLLLLVGLFVVLGISARWVIRSLMVIGARLRIGGFITGFVILGLFTSAPEFLVAVNSVAEGFPSLSLGNLIGASLVLVTLVTGISVLMRGEICVLCMVRRRTLILFSILAILPVLLALDGRLSTTDGSVLIGAFVAYLLYMLSREHLYAIPATIVKKQSVPRAIGLFAIGIGVLIIASRYAVELGSSLAIETGISSLIVGLGVFSIGTNLPEIALVVTIWRESQRGFVFGDVLGSVAANSLIIGILAILRPVAIGDRVSFLVAGGFLAVALVLFSAFAHSGRRTTIRESILLIGLFVAFMAVLAILGFIPESIPR